MAAADNAWRDTTTLIPGDELPGWVGACRQEGNGDILIFASRVLWNSLLDMRLVDEVHLMISPNALADGIPICTLSAAFTCDLRR